MYIYRSICRYIYRFIYTYIYIYIYIYITLCLLTRLVPRPISPKKQVDALTVFETFSDILLTTCARFSRGFLFATHLRSCRHRRFGRGTTRSGGERPVQAGNEPLALVYARDCSVVRFTAYATFQSWEWLRSPLSP